MRDQIIRERIWSRRRVHKRTITTNASNSSTLRTIMANVSMLVVSGLTSRAQARGTNQREPRSGTGTAIPRCLQRFVRLRLHGTVVVPDAGIASWLSNNCRSTWDVEPFAAISTVA